MFGVFCAISAVTGVFYFVVLSQDKNKWFLFPIAVVSFLVFFGFFDGLISGLQECRNNNLFG
jgi:hypothetical protein